MSTSTDTFLYLLKPHYQDALKYCQALCRDKTNAADLFQQASLKALENLDQLSTPDKFKAWYFRIVTTTFYRQAQRSWWRNLVPLKEETEQCEMAFLFEEDSPNPRCELLYAALARLKPKERAAILLFEVGDFSLEQIREIQEEKSLSSIKSRLSRAREKLRQAILHLETKNPLNLPKGDLNHEATSIISRYR